MIISGIEILFTQIFEIIQIFGLEALSREELETIPLPRKFNFESIFAIIVS